MSERWTDAQRFAVKVLNRNLLVTAGAGTGKTAVLVAHALEILSKGTPPHRLLVITFTRKAADQLREKLFKELSETDDPVLRSVLPLLPRAYISTIHSFCQRLLRESAVTAGIDPGFHIIDETARDLLLNETIREVVDRRYEDKDSQLFASLADLCPTRDDGVHGLLQNLLHTIRATEDPYAVLDLYKSGDPRHYRNLYRELVIRNLEWIRRSGRELTERLENAERLTPTAEILRTASLTLQTLPAPGEPFEDLWRIKSALIGTGLINEKKWKAKLPVPRGLDEETKSAKDTLKKSLDASPLSWLPPTPEDLQDQEKKTVRFGALISDVLRKVLDQYDTAKTRRGVLDFADLELLSARLLDKEAHAGLNPARRFDHVLVDEFQDINPLQGRIIDRLTGGRTRFLVGDLKQCIYQFRQSAPEIFSGLIRDYALVKEPVADLKSCLDEPIDQEDFKERGKASIQISDSFRSRRPVLNFINTLFGHLFNKESLGASFSGQELRPGLAYETLGYHPPDAPPVELHMIVPPPRTSATAQSTQGTHNVQTENLPEEEDSPPARPRSPAEREAMLIAKRILDLINREKRRIWDSETEEWRETRWGDIAVLMRSPGTGWGHTFLKIFRREGIPAIVGRGAGFFQTDEIDNALNLIRTLDNTLNDIPLAALLRSPVFGWKDGDLALLRLAFPEARHLWPAMKRLAQDEEDSSRQPTASRKELASKAEKELLGKEGKLPLKFRTKLERSCRYAVVTLEEWRGRLGRAELGSTLAGILKETGLPLSMGTRSQGRLRQANLQKLIDLVQSYSIDHGHSLTGLLSWLEAVQVEAGELPQTPGAAEGGNAVRILSVHMAKGLEFPVVIVAQLGRRLLGRQGMAPLVATAQGLGMDILEPGSFVKIPTVAHRTLKQSEKRRSTYEEMRILYVALTRAREQLILVGSVRSEKHLNQPEPLPLSPEALSTPAGGSSLTGWILPVLPHDLLPGLHSDLHGVLPHNLHPGQPTDQPGNETAIEICRTLSTKIDHAFPPQPMEPFPSPTRERIRHDEPLPEPEKPVETDTERESRWKTAIQTVYDTPWLCNVQGRYWVTELKQRADEWRRQEALEEGSFLPFDELGERGELEGVKDFEDEESAYVWPPVFAEQVAAGSDPKQVPDSKPIPEPEPAPDLRALGSDIHLVFEQLDLDLLANAFTNNGSVKNEFLREPVREIVQQHQLASRIQDDDILNWIAGFYNSEQGVSLLQAWIKDPKSVHREANFTLKLNLFELQEILGTQTADLYGLPTRSWPEIDPEKLGEEWTLLQGQIDLLWPGEPGVWNILDYKSDRIKDEDDLTKRVQAYTLQINLYELAARKIWNAGKVRPYLYFVRSSRAVEITAEGRA